MFRGSWCRHLHGLASSPRRAGAVCALTVTTFRTFPDYWHYAKEVAFWTLRKEIHAILTETLTCFLPDQAKDLSALPYYKTPTQLIEHPHITKPTHTHTPIHYKTHTYTHTHTLENPHIHTPINYKPTHPHKTATHTHAHAYAHARTHTHTPTLCKTS